MKEFEVHIENITNSELPPTWKTGMKLSRGFAIGTHADNGVLAVVRI